LWNSVHHEQSYKRSRWPTLSRQCAFGVCQCIWVQARWLWCRENFTPPSNFPQSDLGRRVDSRWALPQISSFFCIFVNFCTLKAWRGQSWSGSLNSQPAGDIVINPVADCHCFPSGPRLPSQPESVTALWPLPNYTAWWLRQMCLNNLPKVVIWQCPGLKSILGPFGHQSSPLHPNTLKFPEYC